jgi:hypothetical protein
MFYSMNRVLEGLVAFVIFVHPLGNQNVATIPVLKLGVKDVVPVSGQFATPIMFPVRCDRGQNIYIRFYRYPDPFAAPWVKVSPDGQIAATYSLASVKEYKNLQSLDFAIGPRGEFVVIATAPAPKGEKKSPVLIVTFEPDGSYRGKVELDTESTVAPSKIVALPDGNFFVTGGQLGDNEGSQTQVAENAPSDIKPFNVIVNPAGKIVKNVTIQNDVKSKTSSKQSEKSSDTPMSEISLGEAVVSDDGNIYLMRLTQNPSLFVITSTGQFLRNFEVKRPSETATAFDMKWSAGEKLAFLFGEPAQAGSSQRQILSVVDAETGETQVNYETAADTGAAVACFTPNGITFIGSTDDGHLALQHVVPR